MSPATLAAASRLIEEDAVGLAALLRSGSPTPAEFVEFCDRQALRPLLVAELSHDSVAAVFDDRTRRKLLAYDKRQEVIRQRLQDELVEIADEFGAAGVEFILHKGPYWADRFYGSERLRFYGDLDLLVHATDLEAAERLLVERGYEREAGGAIPGALIRAFLHGIHFAASDRRVDLHWSLGVNAAYRLDGLEIWQSSDVFGFRGRTIQVLSDEHTLMALLVSLFEDLQRGVFKLKGFADLHRVLGSTFGERDAFDFLASRANDGTAEACRTILAAFFCWLDLGGAWSEMKTALLGPGEALCPPLDLLDAPRGSRRNRHWALGHAGVSPLRAWTWWGLSLPVRLAVHESARRRRIRRRSG